MLPKVELLQKLVGSGVIAVMRRIPEESAEQVAESLVAGGITALEVTLDSSNALSTIRRLSAKLKERAVVGAGTVLDGVSARLAIDSGADFLLSPSLHQDVIRTALRYGKIAVPGVMTPTEMITAVEWGADFVKMFPAAGLGASYIKDVKAPFPHIQVIPTGGIDLRNIASFIEAGAAAVGIGGNLLDRQAIAQSDFEKLTETAKQYVAAVRNARR
ncbi:bifunctional 4-hydroxy-2-oxoglutarate aldolase/2-dehydro-3-deoxy-phosphogluconate aldolase [Effusibacillus dendaii]|uniref:2-dehydro-3-deoxy-phosphogluconate aldolase n=1 Tax=Effusibacillus dendaii TaxID=2743772 RepID=A0A7I8DF70_9BACL|nr:bifunctional 4-hydroxy-2-oxoglutarate aldolase/2-dehydro-3-deoxy-phosphogluconate aldolase [Effusibacillus dendaii]BCJ87599.1 2-dehydro-3-deoxy-phosphogluconate aldolase [Effusibacillus dendaii]